MSSRVFHPWAVSGAPLVFAHRGGSRLAPENTLPAFDRAIAEEVDGLELDVHLSRDGEVVVCHDARVDRTTDASGPIAKMTAAELARVDAGYRFVDADGRYPFRGVGVGVPTLREVVARHPAHRLIVELKDDDSRLTSAALAVLREAGAVERTCIGSFHLGALRDLRAREPGMATGAAMTEVRMLLYRSWLGWFPRTVSYRVLQVPERREGTQVASPRLIRGAHRAGVAVQVWVVDLPEDIRRLLSWGVDGFITDRPDLAVPAVREWISRSLNPRASETPRAG